MAKRIYVKCPSCKEREKLIKRYQKREEELLERVAYYKALAKNEKLKHLRNTAMTLQEFDHIRQKINTATANLKQRGGKKQYHNYS